MSRKQAAALDRQDPLAGFRERYHLPLHDGRECAYFLGNSLGLQPKKAAEYVEEELATWRTHAIGGHFIGPRPWKDYAVNFIPPLAALVGAEEDEVVCMNALTVNLHLMMVSFYRPTAQRFKILMERPAFPSDRYAIVSQLQHHGLDPAEALIEVGPPAGEYLLRREDLVTAMHEAGDSLALVLLPGVQYLSGEVLDIEGLTAEAHAVGAIAGWDLAHAAGNVPLKLHDWNVDFAAWCSYKYLNGGPGATAGAFVHRRHGHDPSVPRFAGWWGQDKPTRFLMGPDFKPVPGAEGWHISNSPVLSTCTLRASLQDFMDAGFDRLREKSVALTGYLERRLEETVADRIEIVTPRDPARRGCQLSMRLRGGADSGRAVFDRLGELGMVCDWREPDIIRAAPAPLYNTFSEVEQLVEALDAATREAVS